MNGRPPDVGRHSLICAVCSYQSGFIDRYPEPETSILLTTGVLPTCLNLSPTSTLNMDEREIRARSDALQKAVSGREPTSNVLNILKELQKGVKPTEELLRKTQVGKVVNKVKSLQGVDPAIPRLASEIVSQWRNQIKRSSGAATPTQTAQNGSASPAPAGFAKREPPSKDTGGAATPGIPLDKRTHKTDAIQKSSLTPEPARNNSTCLLYDALVLGSAASSSDILRLAKSIEIAVLSSPDNAKGSHTSDFYKDRIRTLYQNLKNKANPELRQRILSGALSPERFAGMSHEEMKSERQRAEDAKIQKENLSSAMLPINEKSVSDHLECGRCKQKKVAFSQAQTRSADEPMTTFCECMNCGKRWKFS